MSQINTSGINVNYPVPGINQSSQGFRDNFAAIKTNLDTGYNELTDLQNKVVLKAALNGTTLNNDMANTLISNASTRGFRATTYNLGNAISGIATVNASLGDVQYGTIVGNTTLQFTGWSPTGTQSSVQVDFNIGNTSAVITLPAEVQLVNAFGAETLENYSNVGGLATLTIPNGVEAVTYNFSTIDCGNSIAVTPINRPRQSTQIQQRSITPTGLPGDVAGTVSVDPAVYQLPIANTNSADYFTTTGNTAQLFTDMPIVFTGTSMEANITIGTTYYVRNVVSSNTFTVCSSIGGANVNLAGNSSPTSAMNGNPVTYMYVCTNTYDSTMYTKTVSATYDTGNITLNNTNSLEVNAPIVFEGDVVGGLSAGTIYYIKTIGSGGNITISQSRTSGVAGTVVTLANATPTTDCNAIAFIGNDIWKKIPLTSW